jgi:protein-S-isoprenylcysteine O-methyltransferase Ste14
MSLREDLERAGNLLFRWRSYIPLAFLVLVFLPLHPLAKPNTGRRYGHGTNFEHHWKLICLRVSFFGLLIRSITVGLVPSGTSGRNTRMQRARTLNTTGMYSIVRHPLYLGNFFVGFGIALFCSSVWLALVFCLLFVVYYERIMFAEEEFLRKKFGLEFESWAACTPAFLPRFRRWRWPKGTFSIRRVLRKENSTYFGTIAVLTLIEVSESVVNRQKFQLESTWAIIFGLALLTYAVLYALKKFGWLETYAAPPPRTAPSA